MKVLSNKAYEQPRKGFSTFSGDPVTVIGEQEVECEGRTLEQYIYNIDGYTPQNGKPFAALKANIHILTEAEKDTWLVEPYKANDGTETGETHTNLKTGETEFYIKI